MIGMSGDTRHDPWKHRGFKAKRTMQEAIERALRVEEQESQFHGGKTKNTYGGLDPFAHINAISTMTVVCSQSAMKCNKYGHIARDVETEVHQGNVVIKQNDRAPAKVYVVGNAGANPDNVVAELGSFDAIIGMDWLAKHQAVIACAEKIVRIPWKNKTLIIHEVEDKSEKKRLEDVPIVQDFPEVFPEDLTGSSSVSTSGVSNLIWSVSDKAHKAQFLAPGELRVLFVKKKDGSRSSVYSKMGLKIGYQQLRVREDDIPKKLAFRTRYVHSNSKLCHWFDNRTCRILELLRRREELYGLVFKCDFGILSAQSFALPEEAKISSNTASPLKRVGRCIDCREKK
ncbi:putative reverse transcriptase domain-containing protein [Tanacetum coccineum]|uniref:Reverse transcriptase domain-containing protein n=1 Tax=Tanacetum coccineum TaxID=301880 RepID=A0ABQ4XEX7_9ASTR